MAFKTLQNTTQTIQNGTFFTAEANVPASAIEIKVNVDLGASPIPGTSGLTIVRFKRPGNTEYEDGQYYYWEYTGLAGRDGLIHQPSVSFGIPDVFQSAQIQLETQLNQIDILIGHTILWDNKLN